MPDRLTVHIIVGGLVAVVVVAMILAALLILDDHDVAAVGIIAGFGTTALGALAALLASTRTSQDPVVGAALEQAQEAGAARTVAELHELSAEDAKPARRTRAAGAKGAVSWATIIIITLAVVIVLMATGAISIEV